jgi:hypothetical protein
MLDTEHTCRWRLLCFRRETDVIERDHLLELAPRIAEQLGPCTTCHLEIIRLKGSRALTHIVPVLPVETRAERAEAANHHRPRPDLRASA